LSVGEDVSVLYLPQGHILVGITRIQKGSLVRLKYCYFVTC